MESTGLPGHVQISEDTHALLAAAAAGRFRPRGEIEVKGKGLMRTFVEEVAPDPA
jgi:hypothetical protein